MRKPVKMQRWQANYRFRLFECLFLVQEKKGWDEVYLRKPGSSSLGIIRVLPHGAVKWFDSTQATEYLMGVFDNIPLGPDADDSGKLPEDVAFLDKWPGVFELMTSLKYPSGIKRERSSLFVVIEEGTFKISISERTRELSLWATGPTFFAALDCLERRITSDSPEWRASRKGGKGKRG
jgi:hypothetical protein